MNRVEKYHNLHKYFIHADKMRFHFDSIKDINKEFSNSTLDKLIYMNLWYSTFFVFLEA